MGLSILLYGSFEFTEIRTLCAHAEEGSTAVDVGAHVGLFTVPLATTVGPLGRVMAFEPYPPSVDRLRKACEVNGLSNVDVFSVAADSQGTIKTLHLADDPSHQSLKSVTPHRGIGEAIDVPTARLDDCWNGAGRPHVSVMKIDVEGMEDQVLRGAAALIRASVPVVLVEAESEVRAMDIAANLGDLSGRRYRTVRPDGFQPRNYLVVPDERRRRVVNYPEDVLRKTEGRNASC